MTSQSSSRSGTSAGLGLGVNAPERPRSGQDTAGFGVIQRTGTPEPWVRRLADDGLSYYYWNKLSGQVQWTRPEPDAESMNPSTSRNNHLSSTSTNHNIDHEAIPVSSRMRSDSSASQSRQRSHSNANRLSFYSDDSDIFPRVRSTSLASQNQPSANRHAAAEQNSPPRPVQETQALVELTSAERIAQSLQRALTPSPPESVSELSVIVQQAISAVVENIQVNGLPRRPEEDTAMDELVRAVVLAVRNLLYVCAVPTGHIPSNLIPRTAREPRALTTSQALLKPAQRKVTATLSKLVLSARAMQYESSPSTADTPNRIEGDAEELARAVIAFVHEVQQSHNQAIVEQLEGSIKRLRGVFMTANIGLGLVGAGVAGSWKGFGWLSLEEDEEAPGRVLGTEVVTELPVYLSQVEEKFNALAATLRSPDDDSGKPSISLIV